MKLTRIYLLALLTFLPVATLAQVTFTNNDGTFTSNGNTVGSTLSLAGSELTAISGLSGFGIANKAVAFPCTPNCLGTITLTTGALASGTMLTGGTFAANSGMFNVAYTNGVSFSGSFSISSWTSLGSNTYAFSGTVMNGTLTINGTTYVIATATTINLTTTGVAPVITKTGTTITKIAFKDNQGTTNFMAPVPEPGTLSLFGGGLIAIGMLARKKLRSETKGNSAGQ